MTDINDDPFAKVEETGTTKTAPPKKAAPAKAEPTKAKPVEDADPLASFLAEMTIEEEDFEAPANVIRYIKPADGLWVPLRITGAKVEQRDMQAVVAYTPSGEMVTSPRGIDALVDEHGAEQVVEQISLWQFVLEAEHVATCFGERPSAYRLYTQVFPMRIPLKKPRERNGKTEVGFDKTSGKKLLAATRVVKPGMQIKEDEEQLQALADAMVADGGKIVMGRIRHRVKKSDDTVPRKNPNGTFVKCKVDEVEGAPVKLRKDGDTLVYVSSGDAYEGETAGLIPFGEDIFLVPDSSDDGAIVKDVVKREAIYDNLADDVYGVQGRSITVQRNDDTEIDAEVTWDTVGFITVLPIKAGTLVQAVAEGGELITATWLGTHWQETEKPHELQVSETGEVRMVSVIDAAAGSQESYDVFKGDQASS
jgi:hypothetical protein